MESTRFTGLVPSPGRPRFAVHAALMLLTALPFLAGCATNPVTGKKEISLVSAGQEEQMGREGYQAVLAEYGLYNDAAIQKHVNDMGQKLARVSHLPNLDWHFTVIDDASVNAFAMPGGYIYITRGILAHLNSDAQLAGVLGHEIGHVTHRHSAQQITKQQLAGLGLGVASILSPTVGRYGQVAQQALGLLFLKYSRDHENEADALGVDYSTKAGYDPREIPPTYGMLKRVGERAGQRLPGFLSTHPDPGDREVTTQKLAEAAAQGKTGLIVNHNEFIQLTDNIVYGDDPRQGYFEGNVLYHPEMRFTLQMPSGWQYQNTKSAVLAGAPEQRAIMQLSLANAADLSPTAYLAKLTSAGNVSNSRGNPESVGGFPAWVGYIATPGEAGSEQVLVAAFIRKSPEQMFQFLGKTQQQDDADARAILATVRSLRTLSDPARLSPQPARVKVMRIAGATTFASAVASAGTPGIDAEEIAILNNRLTTDRIAAGELVKTVTPPRLH
ncbi:MAG TPA: M48 family metalloprotease [Candidatus Eisenbacteria bacterium]|nr:M48 family metalloprotease [Candidatus Eisenbacteria bacterium]